jgi:hypothetical protein
VTQPLHLSFEKLFPKFCFSEPLQLVCLYVAEFGTSRVKFELDGASIDVDAASFGGGVSYKVQSTRARITIETQRALNPHAPSQSL